MPHARNQDVEIYYETHGSRQARPLVLIMGLGMQLIHWPQELVDRLMQQVRRFRRQGYATELNEANEHAGCVAAPVIDAAGQCVAAISIVAPEQRLGRTNRDKLVAEVRAAAARLSDRLGAPQRLG